jgi:hypothetical protein
LAVYAPPLTIDEGPKPVSMVATAQGGTGPYTCHWT